MTNDSLTIRDKVICTCLLIGNFIDGITYSIIAPFLPQVALAKGCTSTQYGIIFAAPCAAAVVSSPLAGRIIPVIGIRNTASLGLFIVAAGTFLFAYAPLLPDGAAFFWSCLVLRLVDGVGDAFNVTAACTAVAYLYPNQKVGLMALQKVFFSAGYIMGSAIGGVLYEAAGFACPFLVTAIIPLITGIALCIAMPNDKKPVGNELGQEQEESESTNQLKMLFKPGILLNTIGVTIGMFDNGYIVTALGLHFEKMDVRPMLESVVFTVIGVSYITSSYLVGRLGQAFNSYHGLIIVGVLCHGIVFLLSGPVFPLPHYDSFAFVISRHIAVGPGNAAMNTCTFLDGLLEMPRYGYKSGNIADSAAFSGLWNTGFNVGALIGPILGGVLMDQVGYAKGSLVMLLIQLSFLSAYVCFVFRRRISGRKTSGS